MCRKTMFSRKKFCHINCIVYFCTRKSKIKNLKNKIMSDTDIEQKVKSIIVDKLGVDESEVKNEASFANDLGADSLDIVELIMAFEEEFNTEIPDDVAEKIRTVRDAVELLDKVEK